MEKKTQLRTARWRAWTAAGAVASLSAIAAGVIALQGGRAEATANTAPSAPVVSVAAAEESEITAWDEFSGRLEAVERVDVRSRVAGQVTRAAAPPPLPGFARACGGWPPRTTSRGMAVRMRSGVQ